MSAREAAHAEVVRLLQAAEDEAYAWLRVVQRDAERRRRGSATAGDLSDDPEYSDVLAAFVAIGDVLAHVRRLGA
ncbi:hypothetical protein ABT332_19185 [Saccharomonospora azurea]|uniref:hypothetical protein n=1 Tax=Saccharomonospora azurea TaxID=40988 RepID=UPI00331CF856